MSPSTVRLLNQGETLVIVWNEGDVTTLAASALRAGSRSADALRVIIDGKSRTSHDDVRIVGVENVGAYALRLLFSDGHDRGIYPWSYLRELETRSV